MKLRSPTIVAGIALVAALVLSASALSYEIETHRALSERAIRDSALENILRNDLGISDGIGTGLQDNRARKTILGWISEGSEREDDVPRFLNHFHHPLRPWGQAGLSDIFSGTSSVIWAQTQNQPFFTGSWSWQETRKRFHLALTSEKKEDRESFLAQTFRGLGHQIHLIQDAASVPHARNESHATGFSIEKWTRDFQRNRVPQYHSRPQGSNLLLTVNALLW